MTHKETTNHLRKRLKEAGVKARVDMMVSCGQECIRVFVTGPDVTFTEDQQRQIRFIAKLNNLTRTKGLEIDVDRMTDPQSMHFEYHGTALAVAS